MSKMTKKRTVEERMEELERRQNLYEAILDIDPGSSDHCQGNPSECGDECHPRTCPIQNNRVHDLGSVVATMYEEFRWQKAWADEMEYLRVVPAGTIDRVALRVRKSQIEDSLRQLRESLEDPAVSSGTVGQKLEEHAEYLERVIEGIDGRLNL